MTTEKYVFPGKDKLGELVRQCRCGNEVREQVVAWVRRSGSRESVDRRVSQEQFAQWVSAVSGILVTEAAIGRLERGDGQLGPPLHVLIALYKVKILRLPDGSLCDLNQMADVLCQGGYDWP